MYHYFEAITNTSGDSLIGYYASVTNPGTQMVVPLFADDNGTPIETVSGRANMARTDEWGNLNCYLDGGNYDLNIFAPNGTTLVFKVENIAMTSTQGPPGDPASPPKKIDFLASAGQTTFPASGDFSATDFSYDTATLAVFVNGILIPQDDYMAPGGVSAIVFDTGMTGGEVVTFNSYISTGSGDTSLRADLAAIGDDTKGANLVGFSIGKSAQQKMEEEFALDDVPIGNYTDNNGQLIEAQMDGRRRIKLLTGKGIGFNGEWVIQQSPWTMPLPPAGSPISAYTETQGNIFDGLYLYGEGPQTVVYQADGNYIFTCFNPSPDPANHISFRMSDFTLRSDDTKPHQEPVHQMAIHRFKEALFDRMHFIGSRSDAIWASMGPKETTTAQNGKLSILNCLFDGVDNQNRNVVSPESIQDFVFMANTVRNFTTNFHPGPIDFEPRANTEYRTRNARIIGNLFQNTGGAPFCAYLNNPDYYSTEPGSIIFANNEVTDSQYSMDMSGGFTSEIKLAQRRHDVIMTNNVIRRAGRGRVAGMFGVNITHNRFIDCDSIYLGNELDKGNREVSIEQNEFIRMGRLSRAAVIQDDETINCRVANNKLIDVGHSDGAAGYGFLQRRGAMDVAVINNEIINTTGRIKQAVARATTDAYGPNAVNKGNTVSGVQVSTPDNYKPTAGPTTGLTYVWVAPDTFQAGTRVQRDLTVPGAYNGMNFDVFYNRGNRVWANGEAGYGTAIGIDVNIVRLSIVSNSVSPASSFIVNQNDTFTLVEKVR